MAIGIVSGKDVLPSMHNLVTDLKIDDPRTSQTGPPTIYELRLHLPGDRKARRALQDAVLTALGFATATGGGFGGSAFVGALLEESFAELGAEDVELLMQVASVPIRTELPNGHSTGTTFLGVYKGSAVQDQP